MLWSSERDRRICAFPFFFVNFVFSVVVLAATSPRLAPLARGQVNSRLRIRITHSHPDDFEGIHATEGTGSAEAAAGRVMQ